MNIATNTKCIITLYKLVLLLVKIDSKFYNFRNSILCIGQSITKNWSFFFRCIFLKTYFDENGDF